MVDEKTFLQLSDSAQNCLVKGQLDEALDLLVSLCEQAEMPQWLEEVDLIRADYDKLLSFFRQGTNDESRYPIFLQFCQKAHRLLQQLRRSHHMRATNSLYAILARKYEDQWEQHFAQALDNTAPTPEEQDDIFELLWTAHSFTSSEQRSLRLYLATLTPNARYYFLCALLLANLQFFDAAKFRLLLDYIDSNDANERAVVTMAVAIASLIHSPLFNLFPDFRDDILDQLPISPDTDSVPSRFCQELCFVQRQFVLYKEAKRIQQKMELEVLPGLIKGDLDGKLSFSKDVNLQQPPKNVRTIILEMGDMMTQGVDVNLNTFSALKIFPFFRRIGHWVAPFDTLRPEAAQYDFLNNMQLCDSDRYSLCFLTEKIDESHRSQLMDMMKEKMSGFKSNDTDERRRINLIQNLFRLLRLSPWQALWASLFNISPILLSTPLLGSNLAKQPAYLLETATLFLRYKHAQLAQTHLEAYVQKAGATAQVLAMLGDCHQQQGQFPAAIRHYQQALMLRSDDEQLLKSLQHCYLQSGQFGEQLDILLHLEEKHPDDANLLRQTGNCLMQLQRWEEAEKRFYHLEYLGQQLPVALRALGWCALQRGDYANSLRHYTKLLSIPVKGNRWEDYLRMGHTLWLTGNTSEALHNYVEASRRYLAADPHATNSLTPFLAEVSVLERAGKTPIDIALMRDLIQRELKK